MPTAGAALPGVQWPWASASAHCLQEAVLEGPTCYARADGSGDPACGLAACAFGEGLQKEVRGVLATGEGRAAGQLCQARAFSHTKHSLAWLFSEPRVLRAGAGGVSREGWGPSPLGRCPDTRTHARTRKRSVAAGDKAGDGGMTGWHWSAPSSSPPSAEHTNTVTQGGWDVAEEASRWLRVQPGRWALPGSRAGAVTLASSQRVRQGSV